MNTIYIPSFYLKGFKVIEDLEVKELAPSYNWLANVLVFLLI